MSTGRLRDIRKAAKAATGTETMAFEKYETFDGQIEYREIETHEPTWSKPCERCGRTVQRWPGMYSADCERCGAEYNAFGQRLRDDWRGNRSNWDEDVDDMDGYEMQHAGDDE